MKKIKGQVRQGDVMVDFNQAIPENAKQQEKRLVILAHGEVTGHAHEIDMDAADAWKDGNETVGITVKTKTKIKHQEHKAIPVNPGRAAVRRQSEYSPLSILRVAD